MSKSAVVKPLLAEYLEELLASQTAGLVEHSNIQKLFPLIVPGIFEVPQCIIEFRFLHRWLHWGNTLLVAPMAESTQLFDIIKSLIGQIHLQAQLTGSVSLFKGKAESWIDSNSKLTNLKSVQSCG